MSSLSGVYSRPF